MTLRQMWQRITTSRYARALEAFARLECALREELARERAENHRLRAENRALLNSILGIAGVPPLPVVVAPPPLAPRLNAPSAAIVTAVPATDATIATDAASPTPRSTSKRGASNIAVPMRRRSWQQINRMLEFESTKKKESNAVS